MFYITVLNNHQPPVTCIYWIIKLLIIISLLIFFCTVLPKQKKKKKAITTNEVIKMLIHKLIHINGQFNATKACTCIFFVLWEDPRESRSKHLNKARICKTPYRQWNWLRVSLEALNKQMLSLSLTLVQTRIFKLIGY